MLCQLVKPANAYNCIGGEGFRTALQNALTCIQELEYLVRTESSNSFGTSSTTKSDPHVAKSLDLNAQRIAIVTKLINIFRRHLRVRYELPFDELVHA